MTVAVATLAFETAALVALGPQTVATTAFIFLQVLIRTSDYQKPIRKLLKIGTDLTLTLKVMKASVAGASFVLQTFIFLIIQKLTFFN